MKDEISKIVQKYSIATSKDAQGNWTVVSVWCYDEKLLSELEDYINKIYIKGAEDFCDWNCLHADGGYKNDLKEFLKTIKEQNNG